MKRTMVYLPEPLHRGLKHLAIERHTSLTSLVREGVEALYQEDLEDIRIGENRLKKLLSGRETAAPYMEYHRQRLRRRRRHAA